MELSFNLDYYAKDVGLEKAAKIVSEAGIKLLDYTPKPDTSPAEWYNAIEIFEKNELGVYQCHAPFNRYGKHGSVEEHKQKLDRCVDMAMELGAKYLVVHGDEFDFDTMTYSAASALEYNYNYFAPIVEKCAKNGIYVAFENVFEDGYCGEGVKPRYGSNPDDLCALIDKYNSEYVCCCWDFGHGAAALGEKCGDGIRKLGKRIECTHVHDNYFSYDMHLVPFLGKIDWKDNMHAMKGSNCDVLSFEIVYGSIPEAVMPAHANMLVSVGKELNKLLK